jgi:hypothetical protein
MREYEIHFPMRRNDGTRVDDALLAEIKNRLTQIFGGYTHLRQHNEGVWRMGGVTFHDEITILRVLDESDSHEARVQDLKCELERRLGQQAILIVAREVQVL